MPTAAGLPFLTGSQGLESGFNMGNRMLQQLLARQQLAQQGEQFQQQQALREQQEARAQQMAPLQQQALKMEVDPSAKIDYLRQLLSGVSSLTSKPGARSGDEKSETGFDFSSIAQSPLGAALIKSVLKIDPYAETPQMKADRELNLFKQKEAIKSQSADGQKLTPAVKTKLQNVITGVDSASPVLEELLQKDANIPMGYEWMNPSAYAAYNSMINSIVEPLIGAFGLNVTDATKQMVLGQVQRRTNESKQAYRKRLQTLFDDLKRRKSYAHSTLQKGTVEQDISNLSDEELQKIAEGK